MNEAGERLTGLFLFLPVPLVLWLLVRAPAGVGPSLAAAGALIATHRLYARPWAIRRAGRRCLWCCRTGPSEALDLRDPLGPAPWSACGPSHAALALGFVGWAERHALPLRIGILGSLAALVAIGLAAATGKVPEARYRDAVAVFQAAVAVSVLPLSLWGPRATPPASASSPFPLHLQALIGSANVIWLFRGIGVIWLMLAVRHGLAR